MVCSYQKDLGFSFTIISYRGTIHVLVFIQSSPDLMLCICLFNCIHECSDCLIRRFNINSNLNHMEDVNSLNIDQAQHTIARSSISIV